MTMHILQARLLPMVVFGLCVVTGFLSYRITQLYHHANQPLSLGASASIAACEQNWEWHEKKDQELQTRIQTQMPTPIKWITLKGGYTLSSRYTFQFFGIDDQRGYVLSFLDGYEVARENSVDLKTAERHFQAVTNGLSADFTGAQDLYSPYLPCDFLTIAYPAATIEAMFIGFPPIPKDEESTTQPRLGVLQRVRRSFNQLEKGSQSVLKAAPSVMHKENPSLLFDSHFS